MVANESQFWSSHQIRLEQVYYEIVTWRSDAGYFAQWQCLTCRPSLLNRLLISSSNDEAYEAAQRAVGEHHRLFHAELSLPQWGNECPQLNHG